MNYFAHLALARPTPASKVGNLLGDFMRGVREDELPTPVRQGLRNHRLVDRLTDHHPPVRDSRRLFAAPRRRFAGVALDVLFDHFLVRHWARFHDRPLDAALDDDYRLLRAGEPLMPTDMRAVVDRMVSQDWIRRYAELDTVGRALDRIAARVRFANRFQGCQVDIERHYRELEAVFLDLYPRLQRAVAEQALEASGPPTEG